MADLASPVAHAVPHIHHFTNQVSTGVHSMSYFLTGAIVAACALSAGIGYYIAKRGTFGVKVDLDNIKNDITALKTKVGA